MHLDLFNLAFLAYLIAGFLYLTRLAFKIKAAEIFARIFLFAGFFFQCLLLLKRWQDNGHFPAVSLYETLVFYAWCAALIYLVFERRYGLSRIGPLISILLILTLGYASIIDKSLRPLMPALKSNWLIIHVISYFLSYAGLAISFIASIMYLWLKPRRPRQAEDMDYLSWRLIAFAFPFLTLGLTSGSVWAKTAWGRYWSWDPKETWALITWLLYAAYLHFRLLRNWQGKKAAVLNIIGFLCVLFTFFGVNYLMKGLHSYL